MEEPLTVGSRMENDEERENGRRVREEAVVTATTMEETEKGEKEGETERETEGCEGLKRYITRQLPDATVRTNCARGNLGTVYVNLREGDAGKRER